MVIFRICSGNSSTENNRALSITLRWNHYGKRVETCTKWQKGSWTFPITWPWQRDATNDSAIWLTTIANWNQTVTLTILRYFTSDIIRIYCIGWKSIEAMYKLEHLNICFIITYNYLCIHEAIEICCWIFSMVAVILAHTVESLL